LALFGALAILGSLASGAIGTAFRRFELDACAACFRQADCNGLLRGACPVFALAYVVNFLANEFAGLGRSRLAFACVPFRSSDSFFFRHLRSPVDFAEAATAHVSQQRLTCRRCSQQNQEMQIEDRSWRSKYANK
jgi:hypothetical protein